MSPFASGVVIVALPRFQRKTEGVEGVEVGEGRSRNGEEKGEGREEVERRSARSSHEAVNGANPALVVSIIGASGATDFRRSLSDLS